MSGVDGSVEHHLAEDFRAGAPVKPVTPDKNLTKTVDGNDRPNITFMKIFPEKDIYKILGPFPA
ncbi:hypothetical protein [Neobacillus mesonae]|uniref:hypothetical protein n=1 Tax=Neobacillus mesonae TaxID=1193713 RepID=UPI00203FCDCB|nr:hypothetical protein [Neobacillus mesonae]MCM3570194.1 hypothetical protein [Neobacillus mesonae]